MPFFFSSQTQNSCVFAECDRSLPSYVGHSGLVPLFMQIVANPKQPRLQEIVACILCNILYANDTVEILVEHHRIIETFVQLLTPTAAQTTCSLLESILIALGNIACEPSYKDRLDGIAVSLSMILPKWEDAGILTNRRVLRSLSWTFASLFKNSLPVRIYEASSCLALFAYLLSIKDEEIVTNICSVLFHLIDKEDETSEWTKEDRIHSIVTTPDLVANLVQHFCSDRKWNEENKFNQIRLVTSMIAASDVADATLLLEWGIVSTMINLISHSPSVRIACEASFGLSQIVMVDTSLLVGISLIGSDEIYDLLPIALNLRTHHDLRYELVWLFSTLVCHLDSDQLGSAIKTNPSLCNLFHLATSTWKKASDPIVQNSKLAIENIMALGITAPLLSSFHTASDSSQYPGLVGHF